MILLQTEFLSGLTPAAAPADSTVVEASARLEELKALSFNDLIERLANSVVSFAINLAIAIFVFYVGRFVIRKIYKVLAAIFLRRQLDKSLSTFILSLVNILLYFILIVTVIGILGIETTSFLAIFASAGVAIGMALSGTLQNFAGGVLILLLKPYRIGDYIEVQGYAGTVKEIQIFFTVITTYDNKSISIPNGGLSTGSVNNWSREAYRRVTWTVAISYGDSVDDAREAILTMFSADERVMPLPAEGNPTFEIMGKTEGEHKQMGSSIGDDSVESASDDSDAATSESPVRETPRISLWRRLIRSPKKIRELHQEREQRLEQAAGQLLPRPDLSPKVLVSALSDSSVDLQVRAWTKTSDYWSVFYYYNEKFYNDLPKHGIHFPFPQLDVHLPH